MALSPDIRKRLLYAKYLLSRAKKAQTERSELAVAASLLLMHDASELLMLAVSDHLQLAKWEFMEFWEKVKQKGYKEPSHKMPMSQLNSLRVGLKHKGTLPHVQTVRDLVPRVDAFCEEVTKDLLELDFAELSLADLVANDDVRNMLREAQVASTNGDKNTAFEKVRIAFDKLERLISTDVSLIPEPHPVHLHRGELPSELTQWVKSFQNAAVESVRVLNVLMLGIDPVRYRFFVTNTPHVSWTLSGKHQAILRRDYNNVPDDIFQTCFDFVVEVALNASR